MPALILLSIILFTTLFRLVFELYHVSKQTHPTLPKNPDTINSNPQDSDIEILVRERTQWRLHFDRRLKFVRILAATAPLLGLLGTVAGMLKTFSAMALGEGFDAIDLIASGISEALITTETGLSIAIVGLILLWALKGCRRRLLIRFEFQEAAFVLSHFEPNPSC
jgi:biopolymer transport protein ExbB/TolQ